MEENRKVINEIDRQLVRLLEKRMDAAENIGRYKSAHNLPMYDPERENERIGEIRRMASEAKGEYLEKIFIKIMEQCRQFEEDLSQK